MPGCVVAVLHGDAAERIELLWSEIGARWGASRGHLVAPPHVTLAIVHGDPDAAQLGPALESVASRCEAFTVSGAGYGVFVGHGSDAPVVHLAVTRTPRLSALHETVLAELTAAGFDLDGQSLPEHWRPHVTLADTGLDPGVVGSVMSFLVEQAAKRWILDVDNVGAATSAGDVTLERRLLFSGCDPHGHIR